MVDIQELVDSLNTTLWRLDNEYKIFDGKCCLVSYYIAQGLEEMGISYNVIAYVHPGTKSKDIYQIAKEENIGHVTIQIATGNKRDIIGEKFLDIDNYIPMKFKMNSDEILKLYENNTWNDEYLDITDEDIQSEIEITFMMTLD